MSPVLQFSRETPKMAGADCSTCSMRQHCMPASLCAEDLVLARKRVRAGAPLFLAGSEFGALYAIRSGFFKTVLGDREGREQVTGFHMGGDLLGLDSLGGPAFLNSAVALEDSEVCVLPYALVEKRAGEIPALQSHLYKALAGEIARGHTMMLVRGAMQAEERLATFLIDLSQRLARRHLSASEFHLRMSRQDIGSYLGLELETVSRQFSKLHDRKLIEVNQKHVRIIDLAGLALPSGARAPARLVRVS